MAIYGMGADTRVFEQDILLRLIKGVDVNWYETFNNSPYIILQMEDGDDFDIFRGIRGEDGFVYNLYAELGSKGKHIYYCPHNSGFVKYFSHSGNPLVNEGGFGGAKFGVHLDDGSSKVLTGPWSSRATAVNMFVEEERQRIADVTVATGQGGLRGTAIKEEALKFLLNHFKFPHHVIREAQEFQGYKGKRVPCKEKSSWSVSLQPDAFVKPGGKSFEYHDYEGIEVLYSPS